jgi:Mrp family chromosome partitioning ATPase/capsular polysaccharide biosynthesis protein
MTEASRRAPLRAVVVDAPGESERADLAALDPRPTLVTVAARNLLLLFLAGILGGIAGLVLSQLQAPTYSATARLFLVDPNRDFGIDPDRAPWTDPLRYTRMRAELVASGPVFDRVARTLGTSPEDIADRVKVLPSRQADFVEITGVAGTEHAAKRLVSLVQLQYESVTTSAQQAPYRRALEQVRRDRTAILQELRRVNAALAASPGTPSLLAERSLLQNHYRFLRNREATLAANAGLLGGGVMLAETPVGSGAPISPRPMRNAAIGGLFGSILLVALLWWRAGRKPTAVAPDLVEPVLGGSLLVEFPPPGRRRDSRAVDDAFDQLASAAASASEARIVLVAPVREADRRPAIPVRLAAALAGGSKRVVVIDASDSRALTENVGALYELGLSEVGDDGANALDLVRNAELRSGQAVPVLGAGRRPRAPDRTARYEQAVSDLLKQFDTVVVDAPPARALASALSLDARSVAIVVTTPETALGAIAELRRELLLLRIPLLGFVFVRGQLDGVGGLRAVPSEPAQTGRAAARRFWRWHG